MRKQKASTPFLLGVFAALLACTSHTLAADEAGTVKTLKGTATIERNGSKAPATTGSRIQTSDRISTGAESSIGITLRDNTLLTWMHTRLFLGFLWRLPLLVWRRRRAGGRAS